MCNFTIVHSFSCFHLFICLYKISFKRKRLTLKYMNIRFCRSCFIEDCLLRALAMDCVCVLYMVSAEEQKDVPYNKSIIGDWIHSISPARAKMSSCYQILTWISDQRVELHQQNQHHRNNCKSKCKSCRVISHLKTKFILHQPQQTQLASVKCLTKPLPAYVRPSS